MAWFCKSKSLKDHLCATKDLKISGVLFTIKKINALDYLDGSKILQEQFSLYSQDQSKMTETSMRKIKEHYTDIFMSGVVKPALSRKNEGEDVWVEDLFQDWDMASELYEEIITFTHGKKKS